MSGMMKHQHELAFLTAEEPTGIRQAASVAGEYLDACDWPPPAPVVVWATFPNCFTEAEDGYLGVDANAALLFVRYNVAVRVMSCAEFVLRQVADQWLTEQLRTLGASEAEVIVVLESREGEGNRVCVYGFGRVGALN